MPARAQRPVRGDRTAHRVQRHGPRAGGHPGARCPGLHRVSLPAAATGAHLHSDRPSRAWRRGRLDGARAAAAAGRASGCDRKRGGPSQGSGTSGDPRRRRSPGRRRLRAAPVRTARRRGHLLERRQGSGAREPPLEPWRRTDHEGRSGLPGNGGRHPVDRLRDLRDRQLRGLPDHQRPADPHRSSTRASSTTYIRRRSPFRGMRDRAWKPF